MQEFNYEKESMIKDSDNENESIDDVNSLLDPDTIAAIDKIRESFAAIGAAIDSFVAKANEAAQSIADALASPGSTVSHPEVVNSRMKFSGNYGSNPYYRKGRYDQHRRKDRKK